MTILINPGSPITVTPDPCSVSKDDGSEVEWKNNTGGDFDVDFQGKGPFQAKHFDKNQNRSGKVRSDASLGRYKYTVTIGGQSLDPIIIVQ